MRINQGLISALNLAAAPGPGYGPIWGGRIIEEGLSEMDGGREVDRSRRGKPVAATRKEIKWTLKVEMKNLFS